MEAAALQIRFHDGKTVAGGSLGGLAEGTRRCPTSATITFLRRESSRSISPGMKPYFPLFKLFISAQNCASFAAARCPGLAIAAFDRVKVAESRRETIVLTWFANFSLIGIIFPQFSYFHSGNIGHYSASCCCHDVTLLFRCFLFPPSTF